MDDLFTELGRQINNATKKILTPEEMASLKADVRKAGQDISQEMGEANQALIQALFMETVLALVPEGTGESASWRLIEDPGQVSEEVWRASQAPMLLLCREDASALIERLTATQTTVLQLLETSQLP